MRVGLRTDFLAIIEQSSPTFRLNGISPDQGFMDFLFPRHSYQCLNDVSLVP